VLHCATLACAQDWAAGTPQSLIWTILVPLLHGSRQHKLSWPLSTCCWCLLYSTRMILQSHAACEHSIFKITMHYSAAGGKALLKQLFASIPHPQAFPIYISTTEQRANETQSTILVTTELQICLKALARDAHSYEHLRTFAEPGLRPAWWSAQCC